MKFMLLVKASKESEAGVPRSTDAFDEELKRAGVMVAAQGLAPSAQGARVRVCQGETSVKDGPLTDAGDLVAGYWVIETANKDQAIDWAKRAPFEAGEVELRQLMEVPGGNDTMWQARAASPGKFRYVSFVMADDETEKGIYTPNPKVMEDINQLVEEMSRAGYFLGAGGLMPSSSGARIRYFGRKRTIVDGPFTEAKELVGGFALLQASSKAEMIAHAKRFCAIDAPGRFEHTCNCEVRPLQE
jgi:hypothetical protein